MAARLAAREAGKPPCTGIAQGSSGLAWGGQGGGKRGVESTDTGSTAQEAVMREQMMWFAFFVALMFLMPPLVAMDLLVP